MLATPNWPWPPVCFLYLPSASASFVMRLSVRYAHVFCLHVDAELAVQPFTCDGQVRLAGSRQQGLVRLVDPLAPPATGPPPAGGAGRS